MPKLTLLSLSLLLLAQSPEFAQYPGQQIPPGNYPPGSYPPPGAYPPGRGPGGGSGIPQIHRKNDKKKAAQNSPPDFFQDGVVDSNDGKQLVLKTDDGRTLTVTVTPQTIWQNGGKPASSADIHPEMVVHLEAIEDGEAFLTAGTINVTADKQLIRRPAPDNPEPKPDLPAKATEAKAADQDTTVPPDPTSLGKPPDDPDRPVLRRGKPSGRQASNDPAPAATVPVSTRSAPKLPAKKASDPNAMGEFTIEDNTPERHLATGVPTLIAQSMDWVTTFTNGLPNFLCQQITTRYGEESKNDWHPIDIITAKVVYENGRENYRDITVGGKKTNKSMLDLGGATSTGEFAATVRDIFWPGTKAQFKLSRSGVIANTPVNVYDFTVDLDHSHWTIKIGSQSLRPVFSGQVWVDKATAEVRKIEMQADDLPKNFPLRSVYSSVAYDPVHLGTANFLLPVEAVNQSCERKSTNCTKNEVEWRDYHKYSGESTITYQ